MTSLLLWLSLLALPSGPVTELEGGWERLVDLDDCREGPQVLVYAVQAPQLIRGSWREDSCLPKTQL